MVIRYNFAEDSNFFILINNEKIAKTQLQKHTLFSTNSKHEQYILRLRKIQQNSGDEILVLFS